VSKHHVIPRLKPGGRKTLKDGIESQGVNLLFHNLIILPKKGYEQFTNKKNSREPLRPILEEKSPVLASISLSLLFVWFFHKNDHTRGTETAE